MSQLRGRIAKARSCIVHGDNGCEIQGDAGPLSRTREKRLFRREVDDETRGLFGMTGREVRAAWRQAEEQGR